MGESTSEGFWSEILEKGRQYRQNGSAEALESFYRTNFDSVRQQVDTYRDIVQNPAKKERMNRQEKKELITSTRSSLRFALVSLSPLASTSNEDDVMPNTRQNISLTLMQVLIDILACQNGDSTCRTQAAKVLHNIITGNAETATVLRERVAWGLSDDAASDKIRRSHQLGENTISPQADSISWTELLITNRSHRETLGALVATVYNVCVVLESSGNAADNEACCDSLLVATLVRQLISIGQWKELMEQKNDESENLEQVRDPATEWIVLLIRRWYHKGQLQSLLQSVCGDSVHVIPEQLVLISCLEQNISEENPDHLPETEEADLLFLAEAYQCTSQPGQPQTGLEKDQKCLNNMICRIVGERLGVTSDRTALYRDLLSSPTCSMIHKVLLELAALLEILRLRNEGLNSRDIQISSDEQSQLIDTARLLGNLCFLCRSAQDTLRKNVSDSQNGLHLLLHCTSYAHSCFTLREWAVVAIRNALQDNLENMECVEKLQAQAPVQSSALNDLGLQVSMDKGKVSVKPLDDSR